MRSVAVGAGTFLALHLFFVLTWEALFQPAELAEAWFMASRSALITTQIALGVVAMALQARRAGGWLDLLLLAGRVAFGAMAACVLVFFWIGPAELMSGPVDLWPMALTAAFFLLAPAVLAGAFLGRFVRGLVKK